MDECLVLEQVFIVKREKEKTRTGKQRAQSLTFGSTFATARLGSPAALPENHVIRRINSRCLPG